MNRSILKRTIIGLALCVGVGVLAYGWDWYCNNPDGKVDQVQLSIEVTELYTEDDIRKACTVVEAAFKEYKGCTLYQLRYSDEECVHIIESYAEFHGLQRKDVLVIRGTFESGKKQLRRPYILPYTEYNDFIWTLCRDTAHDTWYIVDAY